MVNATPRPFYTRERDPVLIVEEAGCAPGPVWTGVEYLASTGIWTPNRPARSESLYRLSYPGRLMLFFTILKERELGYCVLQRWRLVTVNIMTGRLLPSVTSLRVLE